MPIERAGTRIPMRIFAVGAALIMAGIAWCGSTTRARIDTPPGPGIDPFQLMLNAKDLPDENWNREFWAH
jgi:hypothetical protein